MFLSSLLAAITLPQWGFIQTLADFFKCSYNLAFWLSAAAAVIVLICVILLIVFLMPTKKKKAKKQAKQESRLRAEVADGGNYYQRDTDAKPLLSLEPEQERAPETGHLENEPPYKSYSGAFVRLDIGDDTLLDLIYEEIIAKRDDISKTAFLEDANYAKAYLDYVKERLMRLQIRGIGTQEAINIYFKNAPLVVPERAERRKSRVSELEKQAIKQQLSIAAEGDNETLLKHITALEKQIEKLNDEIAESKDRKEKAETNRQIDELRGELDETRRMMREKEEAEKRKEAEAEAARKRAAEEEAAKKREAEEAAAAAAAQNARDEERKEYEKRMRQIEEERVAFFRDYAKSTQNQGNIIELKEQTPAEIETLRRRVPEGYVLLRRKDGSIALMRRSSLPSNVRLVTNLSERIVDVLQDGTVVRADGSMVRPDGKVLRPVKQPATASEYEYREVLMNERRELQKQRERTEDDEITKIETALKQGKKGR